MYLLEIVAEKYKINATETQLGHANEQIDEAPNESRPRSQSWWSVNKAQFDGFGKVWIFAFDRFLGRLILNVLHALCTIHL